MLWENHRLGMMHQGLWHPGEGKTKKAPKEKALKILEI
jgi:hypothetical protein